MQISAINSVSKANAYSKLSETKNRYYSPVNMTSKDVFTRSTGNVAPMPVFKQNAKEIQVISFGVMRPTPEIIKPALQMRVQGVRHLQHNMDPELMKQGVFSINKLAESAWKDGEKLTFKLGRGIDLMSRFGKIGRVPDEISKIIMPVVKIISMNTLLTLGIAGIKHDSKYIRNQEEKLDNLLGMEETKRELKSIVKLLKFQRERKQKGVNVEGQHNVFMFLGAPGTAKTTAAKALGSMLREERLLKRDRFISVNGSQLKAGYVGQTAARVENLFKNYDIILIDEAYSLTASQNGEMDIFGQEALAQLAIELERHAEDKVVIFAGYGGKSVTKKDNKMEGFLTANPGIKSRINHVIYFDSYSPEVMVRMVHAMAKRKGYKMLKSADTELTAYFTERCADKAFGNGREARRFLENMERVVAERFYDLGLIPGEIITVKKSDVINTIASVRGCDMREHTRYGLI